MRASGYAIKEKAASYVGTFTVVKPRDIMNMVQKEYGLDSNYSTTWYALNESRMEKQHEGDESFMLLKDFLQKAMDSNPGTVTSLECANDHTFTRAFLCPRANQLAFKYCRPILILDACHLKSVYGGVVMSGCAHDGEGRIVSLAVGITSIENDDNWTYFLANLAAAIPELRTPGMVIMHEREKGIHNAQASILPYSHESVCVFHLEKNLNDRFKSKFQRKIWAAAKATTNKDFEAAMTQIRSINAEAESHLLQSNPGKWAASKFPVPRFGCTTSNSAESLNSWLGPLRFGSHLHLLASWLSKVAKLMYDRHQELSAVVTELSEPKQKMLNDLTQEGSKRRVIRVTDTTFEVVSYAGNDNRIVDLHEKSCSCGKFVETQFPCLHAAVAIKRAGLSYTSFIHPSYLTSSLGSLYSHHIRPVDLDSLESDHRTLPPRCSRKMDARSYCGSGLVGGLLWKTNICAASVCKRVTTSALVNVVHLCMSRRKCNSLPFLSLQSILNCPRGK